MFDYPAEAVHEALVNALVHREYMIQGSEIHIDIYDDRLEVVSPGGMPDGKRIQDLNVDAIPSTRRNPVLCDIFSRLKLMERRGSGLRKIIDQYPEDAPPSFHSTSQSFVATLRNLNYGKPSMPNEIEHGAVGIDNGAVGIDNGNVGIDNGAPKSNAAKVLSAISAEPRITQKKLAETSGLSKRTVSREIKNLRDTGVIRRIGSDRMGYWEIIK
jgi:predicted HTH transcriptional regulator